MQSIFRYPGGKTKATIQSCIISHRPEGVREYREPFVGGGGIFFGQHEPPKHGLFDESQAPFDSVWLNDKHQGLIEVYKALRDRPEEFIAACKAIPPAKQDDPETNQGVRGGQPTNARLKTVFDEVKLNPDCDQALRYFFVNRTVHGSGRVNYDIPSRLYFSNPNGWNIVETGRLEDASRILSGVKLTSGDYVEVFDAPGEDVWIYADPPYVANSDLSASSQLYQHSFTREDHAQFAEVVKRCQHKVCISYDEDEEGLIRYLFPEDQFWLLDGSWKYAGTTEAKKRNGRELLILNYEPPSHSVWFDPAQEDSELSQQEQKELERLESEISAAIGRKRDAFLDIGRALAGIRDSGNPKKRLYRKTHHTFEDYCHDQWGMCEGHCNRIISAWVRYEALKKTAPIGAVLPANESQVRALARCETDEQAAEVWQAVVEDANESDQKITASFIKQYVDAAINHKPAEKDHLKTALKLLPKLTDDEWVALLNHEEIRTHVFRNLTAQTLEVA